MDLFEDENLVVKPSPIHGLGLFAKRDFTKGEVVTRWKAIREFTQEEYEAMSLDEKKYVVPWMDGAYAEIGIPERYVNRANDANTEMNERRDVATRDIKVGEEITADYRTESVKFDFEILS